MALWSAEQLQRVREIIGRYHAAIALALFGAKSLPPDLVKDLRGAGINIPEGPQLIGDAYAYGQLLALLRDPQLATKSPAEIAKLVEQRKLELRLTPQERAAVDVAAKHAGQYVVGLGTRVAGQVMGAITGVEANLTPERMVEVIQEKTAANIAKREAIDKLKSDLGWAMGNWTRDWQRIAMTETNNAIQEGTAAMIERKHGADERVSKIPRPDACPICKRLYLDANGDPKIFKLSELRANGSNVGRKPAAWKPVVEAVHPWCGCVLVRVPDGMTWIGGELHPKRTEPTEEPTREASRDVAIARDIKKKLEKIGKTETEKSERSARRHVPLVLDIDFEKGLSHKYLARYPNQKPPPRWRYVYDYAREGRYGDKHPGRANLKLDFATGTKFRDEGLNKQHGGHWEVEQVASNEVRLRHDVTGEIKTFDTSTAAAKFLRDVHSEAMEETRELRRRKLGELAKGSLVGYEQMKERFAHNPHHPLALVKLSRQWNRIVKYAEDADWEVKDWLEALKGDTTMPESWDDAARELRQLHKQLRTWMINPEGSISHASTIIGAYGDPLMARAAARYLFLKNKVRYEWEDVPGAVSIDIDTVLAEVKKKSPTEQTDEFIINTIKKLAKKAAAQKSGKGATPKGYRRRGLDRVVLEHSRSGGGPDKDRELRYRIREVATSEGASAFFGIGLLYHEPTGVFLKALSDHANKLGASPRPEMYVDGWRPETVRFELPNAPDEWTKADYGIGRMMHSYGADPIVTFQYEVAKGERFNVRAPVSVHRRALEAAAAEKAGPIIADHKTRVAKYLPIFEETARKSSAALEAVDDKVDGIFGAVLEKHAPSILADEYGKEGTQERIASAKEELISYYREARAKGQSPVDAIKGIHRELLPSMGVYGIDLFQTGLKFAHDLHHAIVEQQLEDLRAAHGVEANPRVGLERVIQKWSDKEKEDSIKAAHFDLEGNHTTATASSSLYDIEKDPGNLKRLLKIANPDVLPEVRIEIHPGMGRAHCSYNNVIRLGYVNLNDTTLLHEYGHAIEHDSNGITEAANTLRDERGKNTPLRRLEEIHPAGYKRYEETYEDQWTHPYTGKWYGHMTSTEVMSTGLEQLFADPHAFHRRDPQHFGFVVAALFGKLGKRDRSSYREVHKQGGPSE